MVGFPSQARMELAVNLLARSAVRAAFERLLPWRSLTSPVELTTAAKDLGARDVLYGARTDGLTLWDERGATIHLALARSVGRRRATLAHECGHLMMDPLIRTSPFRNAPKDVQSRFSESLSQILGEPTIRALRNIDAAFGHERFCDFIGNELILPEELVRSVGEDWDGSISQLRQMSSRLRVSLTALTIALNQIGFRRTLIVFRRTSDGSWLAIRSAGAPFGLHSRVTCPSFQASGLKEGGSWQGEATIELRTPNATLLTPASVRLTVESALVICETARLDKQLRTRTGHAFGYEAGVGFLETNGRAHRSSA